MAKHPLKILKLVFIWTNLELKPVLKKTNFKLVLFCPNFSPFILCFLTSYQLIISPLTLTTVRRYRPPPFAAAATVPCRVSLITNDNHKPLLIATIGKYWLPPTATSSTTICRCSPLPPTPSSIVCHCFPSPALSVDNDYHCLSSLAVTAHCHRLLPPITADRHCPSPLAAAISQCPPPLAAIVH